MTLAILTLLLAPVPEPARMEAGIYLAAVAWDHDPAMLRGLAYVESTMQRNPPRAGHVDPRRRVWGRRSTSKTHPHRYLGLLQTREYPAHPCRHPEWTYPPGELLVWSPAVSAWYGSIHLAGWRERCGSERMWDAYNSGSCKVPGSFTRKVMRFSRRGR